MAHMIDFSNRRANIALAASGGQAWHGLGKLLTPDAGIDTWIREAGLDYKVKRARVRFNSNGPTQEGAPISTLSEFDGRVVLFRSDTRAGLGIVSDRFQVVQPHEVVELFAEYVEAGAAKMESAAALFRGARYFASAKIGDAVDIGDGDKLMPYVLFSTAVDGSLPNEVRWTSVRTVCNNTLFSARQQKALYRCTHRSAFDAKAAKESIEQARTEFGAFMTVARKLREINFSATESMNATRDLFEATMDQIKNGKAPRGYERVLALFNGEGKGSKLPGAAGTAWGWLNAVTEYVDHDVRARSAEHRFVSGQSGPGAALKAKAVKLVTA